jgi:hypothetical protein
MRKYSKSPSIPAVAEFALPVLIQLHAQFFTLVSEGIRHQNGGWVAKAVDWVRRLLK